MIKYPALLLLALCLCVSGCFVTTHKADGSTSVRTMTLGELWKTMSEPGDGLQPGGSAKATAIADNALGDLFAALLLPEGTSDSTVATEIMKVDKKKITVPRMKNGKQIIDSCTLSARVYHLRGRTIMHLDLDFANAVTLAFEDMKVAITKHPNLSLTYLGDFQVTKNGQRVYRLAGKGKRPAILQFRPMMSLDVDFMMDLHIRYDLSPDKEGFAALSRGD